MNRNSNRHDCLKAFLFAFFVSVLSCTVFRILEIIFEP